MASGEEENKCNAVKLRPAEVCYSLRSQHSTASFGLKTEKIAQTLIHIINNRALL